MAYTEETGNMVTYLEQANYLKWNNGTVEWNKVGNTYTGFWNLIIATYNNATTTTVTWIDQ
jgi:hypothetical protein